MSERTVYPPGVPCWIEALHPDPKAAFAFYGPLFGWDAAGPGPMAGDRSGAYYVAQLRGYDVAGIGTTPPQSGLPATWTTYVRVSDAAATARRAQEAGGHVLSGALDALPAGRLAVLADPAGAVFCAWEAKAREGAQLINEPCAWKMSALHTPDLEAAKSFYREVFGWHAERYGNGPSAFWLWRLPGYVGGRPQQPVPRDVVGAMIPLDQAHDAGIPPHWSVDFWIHDVTALSRRAADLGGKVVVPPFKTPTILQAVLADPEGATFTISELAGVT
jgi:predicted enzyme related to lactoylglutathione lyase